jgi:hypothetical protein
MAQSLATQLGVPYSSSPTDIGVFWVTGCVEIPGAAIPDMLRENQPEDAANKADERMHLANCILLLPESAT